MITTAMLRAEKNTLEKQLADYEPKRRRLGLINELLKTYDGNEEASPRTVELPKGTNPARRFAGMGATEATIAFLSENPTRPFLPRQIAAELESGGAQNNSENFVTMISAICSRIAEKGRIEQTTLIGRKAYQCKRGNS